MAPHLHPSLRRRCAAVPEAPLLLHQHRAPPPRRARPTRAFSCCHCDQTSPPSLLPAAGISTRGSPPTVQRRKDGPAAPHSDCRGSAVSLPNRRPALGLGSSSASSSSPSQPRLPRPPAGAGSGPSSGLAPRVPPRGRKVLPSAPVPCAPVSSACPRRISLPSLVPRAASGSCAGTPRAASATARGHLNAVHSESLRDGAVRVSHRLSGGRHGAGRGPGLRTARRAGQPRRKVTPGRSAALGGRELRVCQDVKELNILIKRQRRTMFHKHSSVQMEN